MGKHIKSCLYDLTRTLAWAAGHRIPLHEAVADVTRDYRPSSADVFFGEFLLGGSVRGIGPLRRPQTTLALEELQRDLEEGIPLADSLEAHFSYLLPAFYVPAVRAGEQAGRLPMILDLLADRLRQRHAFIGLKQIAIWHLMFNAVPILVIASGMSIFIVPKFGGMLDMTLDSSAMPRLSAYVNSAVGLATEALFGLPVLACLLLLGWLIVGLPGFAKVIGHTIVPLPVIGHWLRQQRLMEAARGMAAYLSLGHTLPEAVAWAADATPCPWTKRKLRTFHDRIASGRSYTDAWRELRLGGPLEQWLVVSSAAREAPAEGFTIMADLLNERLQQHHQLLVQAVRPAISVFFALIVLLLILGVFGPLAEIYIHLSR